MNKSKVIIILFAFITSCNIPKAEESFKPFSEKIDSTDINPGIDFDYFEFRIGPNSRDVFVSRQKDSQNEKIRKESNTLFDSIHVESGFSKFPHLIGYHYILSRNNGKIEVWNSISQLKHFLGDIDTETEAQLYAMALGFPPSTNDTVRTGVKRKNDFFIVRVSRMDELCAPIIVNRYTFAINKNGILDTLEIKEISRDEKGCI